MSCSEYVYCPECNLDISHSEVGYEYYCPDCDEYFNDFEVIKY